MPTDHLGRPNRKSGSRPCAGRWRRGSPPCSVGSAAAIPGLDSPNATSARSLTAGAATTRRGRCRGIGTSCSSTSRSSHVGRTPRQSASAAIRGLLREMIRSGRGSVSRHLVRSGVGGVSRRGGNGPRADRRGRARHERAPRHHSVSQRQRHGRRCVDRRRNRRDVDDGFPGRGRVRRRRSGARLRRDARHGIADGVPGDDTIELELGRRVGARWLRRGRVSADRRSGSAHGTVDGGADLDDRPQREDRRRHRRAVRSAGPSRRPARRRHGHPTPPRPKSRCAAGFAATARERRCLARPAAEPRRRLHPTRRSGRRHPGPTRASRHRLPPLAAVGTATAGRARSRCRPSRRRAPPPCST